MLDVRRLRLLVELASAARSRRSPKRSRTAPRRCRSSSSQLEREAGVPLLVQAAGACS